LDMSLPCFETPQGGLLNMWICDVNVSWICPNDFLCGARKQHSQGRIL